MSKKLILIFIVILFSLGLIISPSYTQTGNTVGSVGTKPLMVTKSKFCEYRILSVSRLGSSPRSQNRQPGSLYLPPLRREGWDQYFIAIAATNVSGTLLGVRPETVSIYAHFGQKDFDPEKPSRFPVIHWMPPAEPLLPLPGQHYSDPAPGEGYSIGGLPPRYTVIYYKTTEAPTAAPRIDFYLLVEGMKPQRIPIGEIPTDTRLGLTQVFPPRTKDELRLGESSSFKDSWQLTPLDFKRGSHPNSLHLWIKLKNLMPEDLSTDRLHLQILNSHGYSKYSRLRGVNRIPAFMETIKPLELEFEQGKEYALLVGIPHPDRNKGLLAYKIYRFEAQPTSAPAPPAPPAPPTPAPIPQKPPETPRPAPAAPPSPLKNKQTWSGYYVCGQGKTALIVRINSVSEIKNTDILNVEAIFDFDYAKGQAVGKFNLYGRYNLKSRTLLLHPGDWIKRPAGYDTVGMDGKISSDGKHYTGKIINPGCSEFDVSLVE